jgi:23S rRNA (adenine2503-C2)-methyltransferase
MTLNLERLEEILAGRPAYRGRQARAAVFSRLVRSWEEATDLPKELRAILAREVSLEIPAFLSRSPDGATAKAAIRLADGETIETVLMRHPPERNTVCVSSQAGCPLGCDFCLTGDRGYRRNLSRGEIAGQVLFWSRFLKESSGRVRNVVFMGMGEPLLNYDAVLGAVRIFNDPEGLGIGARRISISTAGIVEGIARLAGEGLQVNLAISLNAPDNPLRSRLMPINRTYPIEAVLEAAAGYIEKTGRRLMIEYLLLDGVNDSPAQAGELAARLREYLPRLYFVNLIVYNRTGKYLPSPAPAVGEFVRVLEGEGVAVTRRYRFGSEIGAACGQLAGEDSVPA